MVFLRSSSLPAVILALSAGACLPSYTIVEGTGSGGAGGAVGSGGGDAGPGGSPTDPLNCGATGHDCLGGACDGGVCQPFLLAEKLTDPSGIAVTADLVVFADSDGVDTCPLAGCGAGNVDKVVIAPTNVAPGKLVVGGGWVYWTNVGAGIVNRCPLPSCGKPQIVASSLDSPGDLALDGNFIYLSHNNGGNGEIRRCPVTGCGPNGENATAFTPTLNVPQRIAVSADNVYWSTNDAHIYFCPLGGCPNPPPILTTVADPRAFVLGGGNAYFGGMTSDLLACPLPTCEGGPINIATIAGLPTYAITDESHVYWSEEKNHQIRRALLGGGEAATIATDQPFPTVMAIDAKAVYWVNPGTVGMGQIAAVAK